MLEDIECQVNTTIAETLQSEEQTAYLNQVLSKLEARSQKLKDENYRALDRIASLEEELWVTKQQLTDL
ncbi:hypothetical protein Nepgr_029173 [Nepenthes gracilis]|uniref:Uncharacterized protein n=1 Tax=Nepenthes gracilis TaxID=150966 RepID=A0AAD3Y4M0_NEPGR|nr:hypothetical protein Nepgr_029173 [Nepenthes gracilis]